MCRVLGITHFDYDRHHEIVERFRLLARDGVVMSSDPPGHEDGWGLALYENGQLEVRKSGASLLEEFDVVDRKLSAVGSSALMILHLRKSAWANTSNTRHAHPFYCDNKVFFHNGVVYDYQGLVSLINVPGLPADARDTEVFFYHVLSNQNGGLDLGQAFQRSIQVIKRHHRYSALNSLFSDGRSLYVYRDYAKEPDYYSLFKAFAADSWLFCSEPLDSKLSWQMMAQEEFLRIEL